MCQNFGAYRSQPFGMRVQRVQNIVGRSDGNRGSHETNSLLSASSYHNGGALPVAASRQSTEYAPVPARAMHKEEIERCIVGEALTAFSRLRNVVFHGAHDRTNPDDASSGFHRKAPALGNHYRKIIGGLLRFYPKDPACSA